MYRKYYNVTLALSIGLAGCAIVPTQPSVPVVQVNQQETSVTSTPSTYVVKRVVDGDTIELANGDKVRYLGIDTPETVKPNTPVQCYGREASEANHRLVEGKSVRLEKDVEDKDKYGRLLRYVYVDDQLINLELVKGGYARLYTYKPNVKHHASLLAAEQAAKKAKAGMWGNCVVPRSSRDY